MRFGRNAPRARASRTSGGGSADAARLEHLLDADRVPGFERSELPAESPLHRAVDVVDRVRDFRRDARRVEERRAERGAQEPADFVVAS